MYQTILMDAYIDENAEIGNVGDNARKFHANLKVRHRVYAFFKAELFKSFPRIPARFGQFLHDILQGGQPHSLGYIFLYIYPAAQFVAFDQISWLSPNIDSHFSDHRIALWMNRTTVQRVLTISDAQKASCLFKCLFP